MKSKRDAGLRGCADQNTDLWAGQKSYPGMRLLIAPDSFGRVRSDYSKGTSPIDPQGENQPYCETFGRFIGGYYRSLSQSHAAFMPDAGWAIGRQPPTLARWIQVYIPVSTSRSPYDASPAVHLLRSQASTIRRGFALAVHRPDQRPNL
jgi:hypothetical protein